MKNRFEQSTKSRNQFDDVKSDITKDLAEKDNANPFLAEKEIKKDKVSMTISSDINNFLYVLSKETNMSKSETLDIILRDNIKSYKHIQELARKNKNISDALNRVR